MVKMTFSKKKVCRMLQLEEMIRQKRQRMLVRQHFNVGMLKKLMEVAVMMTVVLIIKSWLNRNKNRK